MKAIWESVKQWSRHNQGIVVSTVLAVIFLIWFFGCQSKTPSIVHDGLLVSEPELRVEYAAEIRRLETELKNLEDVTKIRLQNIHQQDALKQALFNNALLIAEGGTINPLGILSLLGTIFGIGAVIDNRKKDGLIKGLITKPD